jgi:hypothetical protein
MKHVLGSLLFLLMMTTSLLSQTGAPITSLPDGVKLPVAVIEDIVQIQLSKKDTIRLLVTKSLRGADGAVVIPEGAIAFARVLENELPKKEKPARLLMVVEKIKWKGGEMPMHAYVVPIITPSIRPSTARVFGPESGPLAVGFEPHATAGSYLYSRHAMRLAAGTGFMIEQMSGPGPAEPPQKEDAL